MTDQPEIRFDDGAAYERMMGVRSRGAGLIAFETREITVERRFDNLDDFWTVYSTGALGPTFAAPTAAQADDLRARLRASLCFDDAGGVLCSARANVVRGRVPD